QAFGKPVIGPGANNRRGERPVSRFADLRDLCDRREAAIILDGIRPERAYIVQRSWLEADKIAVRLDGLLCRGLILTNDCLVESGRQNIDQVHVAGEFLMLLGRNPGGDEDAQMADALMQGINDGLTGGADVFSLLIEIEDPAQSLLRRGDVIAMGAE